MFCARLFICASWSPAGKGLTSWLSFVVSSVSLSLSHWYPGSGVVLDCIDSWSLQPYLLARIYSGLGLSDGIQPINDILRTRWTMCLCPTLSGFFSVCELSLFFNQKSSHHLFFQTPITSNRVLKLGAFTCIPITPTISACIPFLLLHVVDLLWWLLAHCVLKRY